MFHRLQTLQAFFGSVVTFAFNKRTNCTIKNVDRINIGSKTVGVIHERPFFHRLFSMKIDGIFKNCSCFIDYRLLMRYRILLNFCVWQETMLHNITTLSESKSFKNVGIINDWPFLYRHFCMKIDRIFKNCSCFIDYRLFKLSSDPS